MQGPYTVFLVAGGSAEEQLLCLEVDFDVVYPPLASRAKQSLRTVAGRLGLGQRDAAEEEHRPARHARAQA